MGFGAGILLFILHPRPAPGVLMNKACTKRTEPVWAKYQLFLSVRLPQRAGLCKVKFLIPSPLLEDSKADPMYWPSSRLKSWTSEKRWGWSNRKSREKSSLYLMMSRSMKRGVGAILLLRYLVGTEPIAFFLHRGRVTNEVENKVQIFLPQKKEMRVQKFRRISSLP